MRLSAFAITAAILVTVPAVAQDLPDLKGKWVGKEQGISIVRGYQSSDATIEITEQQGNSFRGFITYRGSKRSDFIGTIAPDGKMVVTAGDDGYQIATLQSPTTLDTCYIDDGAEDMVTSCGRFEKQP
jgi:hypothetical protein